MSASLLEVRHVRAGYGETAVLHGVNLAVQPGETVGLLGRNGMGKTTLIRAVLAQARTFAGEIRFRDVSIGTAQTDVIARAGIALVPEGRQIFPNLTVAENLLAFADVRNGSANPWTIERVYAQFPTLAARARNLGSALSGGEQQMLAIGRALMTNPYLLLIDEATEGLAPLIREQIWMCLAHLKAEGQAMIVVDKYVDRLIDLADHHVILERGSIAWSGSSIQLSANHSLWERYLGV